MRMRSRNLPHTFENLKMSGDNVCVAVRVRSFLPREHENAAVCNVAMKDSTVRLTDASGKYQLYTLDHCFWSHADGRCVDGPSYSDQGGVYNTIGVQLVDNAWAGYNSSILAYGQTGSGKTYSIFGPSDALGQSEHRGLIPRVFEDLFNRIQAMKDNHNIHYKVEVSMVEIYLEVVYDLLVHGKKVCRIHGTNERGFYTPTVTTIEVRSYSEVEKVLAFGNAKKVVASTNLNEHSSRAHTLFDIHLRRVAPPAGSAAAEAAASGECGPVYAKLSLVDLAGSENVKLSGVQGVGVRQASNVNKSLLVLGNCIEACVERGRGRDIMIPFRDSALTQLLKECIGGNSKTTILCTISPSFTDASQSKSTLFFANRAKQIRCHARMNEAPVEPTAPPPVMTAPPAAELKMLKEEHERGMELLRSDYEREIVRLADDLEKQRQEALEVRGEMETKEAAWGEEKAKFEEQLRALAAKLAAAEQLAKDRGDAASSLQRSLENERAGRGVVEAEREALKGEVGRLRGCLESAKEEVAVAKKEGEDAKREAEKEIRDIETIWSTQYQAVKQRAEMAEGVAKRLKARLEESARGFESQAAALQEQDAAKRNIMMKAVQLLSEAKRATDDERRKLVASENLDMPPSPTLSTVSGVE